MKKILLILLLAATSQINAQCWSGSQPFKAGIGPNITAALIVDKSLRYYQSGFSGLGVHAGIWIDGIGFTLGAVESKINKNTPATRELAFTILGRYTAFDEKIQFVPFFAVGSDNFQDVGIRVGYRIDDGVYLGLLASRTMQYGFSVAVSLNHSK
jgi:hypothetical protein